ncbi:MAG: DUF4340 domain-containing protein [Bacteroidetes bacterium]|nr:DUF4340 domain-containing protein [Bacteroidota bacterium]
MIAVIILAAIVALVTLNRKGDRTFRSQVLDFEPDQVTLIEITEPGQTDPLKLIKTDSSSWTVKTNDKEYIGDADAINNVLHMLDKMKTESVPARSEDKWEEYQVDEANGIRVSLYIDDKIIDEVLIGKFSYKVDDQQNAMVGARQNTKMTSYVRPVGEKNIYALDGLLRMNFTNGSSLYRNKNLVGKDFEALEKLTFERPGARDELSLQDKKWTLNGQPADSAATVKYLRSIAKMRNSGFIDTVSISGIEPIYRLTLEGGSFQPVLISAYPAADTLGVYYITSSENPGSIWDGSKGKLFEKIFEFGDLR